MRVVCKFGVIFHIFIISCLWSVVSCMKPVIFLLYNNRFIYQVLCTRIYRRRSLYSFLLHSTVHIHWYHNNTSTFKSSKVRTKLTKLFSKSTDDGSMYIEQKYPQYLEIMGVTHKSIEVITYGVPYPQTFYEFWSLVKIYTEIKNWRQNSILLITFFHTNGVR